ncbi:cyclic nucleotide-gated ion channel [Aureococcus anophagefferens]|nr:cyclic nucleotide-gated ion channel [Aureococcus anophagefferens]
MSDVPFEFDGVALLDANLGGDDEKQELPEPLPPPATSRLFAPLPAAEEALEVTEVSIENASDGSGSSDGEEAAPTDVSYHVDPTGRRVSYTLQGFGSAPPTEAETASPRGAGRRPSAGSGARRSFTSSGARRSFTRAGSFTQKPDARMSMAGRRSVSLPQLVSKPPQPGCATFRAAAIRLTEFSPAPPRRALGARDRDDAILSPSSAKRRSFIAPSSMRNLGFEGEESDFDDAAKARRSTFMQRARTLDVAGKPGGGWGRVREWKWLVSEDSSTRINWDIFVILCILCYVFVMPLRVAFSTTSAADFLHARGRWLWVEFALDVIFIADVCLNFRTSFRLSSGRVVEDSRLIAERYLKSWFLVDFVSSLPIEVATFVLQSHLTRDTESTLKFVRILRILRYTKIIRVMRLVSKHGRLLNSTLNPGYIQLSRLAVIVLGAWHYVACAYWIVARVEGFCDPDVPDDLALSLAEGYRLCLDRCRRASARTSSRARPLEVAFTTVIILWGMLMYASIIGAVSSAVAVLDATGIQRSRKLSAVKSFLVQQNVHKHLQLEIMNYYTYLLSLNTRDSQALSDLPVTLRIKLELSLKQESVDQVPLFHNLDAACILSIVHHLKNCVSLPSEILYAAGALGDRMFVLERGAVVLSVPRNMNHFMALRKAQQRKNRFKASREDRKEGEPIELDRSRSLPAEPSGPRRKRRNSSLSVAPPPAQVQDDLADWRKTMSEFLTASVYSDLDNVVIERLVINAHYLISTQVIKSDYFGEIALLSQPHLTYATSETFSELYELRHADVVDTLREFPRLTLRLKRITAMRIMHVFETLERKARDARAAERESRRGAGPGAAARKRMSTFNSVGSAIRRGSSMSLRKPRTELAERQRSASSRKAWVGLASNDDKEVAAQIIQRNLLRSKRRRSWTGWDALIKDIQSDVREKREAAKRPAVASQVLSLEQRVAGVETKLEAMERLIVAGFDDLRRGHRPPPRGPAPPLHDALSR